ncbi:MAG: aminotransferase class V-fold PLP-dependent enzyme [Candidatus Odinarchaeia archaeon]
MDYPFENIQSEFPILYKKKTIYLDSATKTLCPQSILDVIKEYTQEVGIPPKRGGHKLAISANETLENCRKEIAHFIHAKPENIIFTPNIPMAASNLILGYSWNEGEKLIISDMEHNSIMIPALMAREKFGIKTILIGRDEKQSFDIEKLETIINEDCKILVVTLTPIILGVKNPIEKISKIAHQYGAKLITDCSRGMIHTDVDFKKLNCDALIFSSEIGVTGLGGASVICAKEEFLSELNPYVSGGGGVFRVEPNKLMFSNPPDKFEPGLLNMPSIIVLREALKFLSKIGLNKIREYNRKITKECFEDLHQIPHVKVYGPEPEEKGCPLISFSIDLLGCHDVALFLDEINNITVRSGMQCAHILAKKINENGVLQASFHLYNPPTDMQNFIESLNTIINELS